MNYEYVGLTPRFYPDIVTANGSLIAVPGDVVAFDDPPTDGNWVETDQPVTNPGPRTWPYVAAGVPVPEPDPVSDAELAAGQDLSAGFPAANPTDEVPTQES